MKHFLNNTGLIKLVYPRGLTWSMPAHEKKIYLTFDDGPTPGVTDKLLEILNKSGVKATFFCIGKNVEANQRLFSQILEEEHAVGNHTWNHTNGKAVTTSEYIESVKKAQAFIQSNLFRPPYGRISFGQAKILSENFKIVMWSVLSGDFDLKQSKEECLNTTLKHGKSGSILVFHDSLKASEKMLYSIPKTIEFYKEKGYEFLPIE